MRAYPSQLIVNGARPCRANSTSSPSTICVGPSTTTAETMESSAIDVARSRGVPKLFGEILATNHGMLMMVKKLGFHTERHPEDATVTRATLELNEPESGDAAR